MNEKFTGYTGVPAQGSIGELRSKLIWKNCGVEEQKGHIYVHLYGGPDEEMIRRIVDNTKPAGIKVTYLQSTTHPEFMMLPDSPPMMTTSGPDNPKEYSFEMSALMEGDHDDDEPVTDDEGNTYTRQTWDAFRAAGMSYLVNTLLRCFGWVLVFHCDDDVDGASGDLEPVRRVWPARFRMEDHDRSWITRVTRGLQSDEMLRELCESINAEVDRRQAEDENP